MSDKTDFNDLLPTIQAIPDDAISAINMPVGAFIQIYTAGVCKIKTSSALMKKRR